MTIKYTCNKCNYTGDFSLDGWIIECLCGGVLKPVPYGAYKYICAYCGHVWQSNSNKIKKCPKCDNLNIVFHHEDANKALKALYEDIITNFNNYTKYAYVCPECKSMVYLYSRDIPNVACPNGCK
jgi:rubrerythrin